MTDEPKFTHIGVERKTQRQISILARLHGVNIYDLVSAWADQAWAKAIRDGLVTEAALESPVGIVRQGQHSFEITDEGGKRLLKAIKLPKQAGKKRNGGAG